VPYQLFYSPEQLRHSPEQLRHGYPEIDRCFAAKRKYDPMALLTNKFHDKYGPERPTAVDCPSRVRNLDYLIQREDARQVV
jgi:hypothetical protein